MTWIDSPLFTLDNCKYNSLKYAAVIGHDLSPGDIRKCFETWQDPQLLLAFRHSNHTRQKGRIFTSELKPLPEEAYDEDRMWYEQYEHARGLWGEDSLRSENEQDSWQDSSDGQKAIEAIA